LINDDLEGSGSNLIEILSQHLPAGTKETHLSQSSRCADRDSNQALPEYKTRTFPQTNVLGNLYVCNTIILLFEKAMALFGAGIAQSV
jgi:hypothetical protein